MIPRTVEKYVRELLKGFPIVTITGPRQSGKTTLARVIFADKPYASLEDPDVRLAALDDPRSFLARFPDGAVLDEVQRCPQLLSYLQTLVDGDGRMGLFILTGSQQFGLISGITQSLAGRTAFVELLPFSFSELQQCQKLSENLNLALLQGCYPPIHDREVAPRAWVSAYVTAYIERDVRQITNVQDLETFQRFVRLCAGRTGQLLNLSSLATECGITHNTAKAWISVLEASYLVFLLRPHHANFNKRLVKSPKLYFFDTGLVAWLLGIQSPEQLETHPLRGNIFETFILAELMKASFNRGEKPALYFWRDSTGNEVDVIVEQATGLLPIEIKSGRTLTPDSFAGLEKWLAFAAGSATRPSLIYGGAQRYTQKGIEVFGWKNAGEVLG
ncbi:ATP-binding protein [Geoalkalibacter sp.]|uniref:ATP-binding protein n=1 Tax=Geoalkalibacter sp. TaxID=3041440 RepID=UPI00272E9E38|nr:ATP-binding protein [Geoalkalibacter sp.]